MTYEIRLAGQRDVEELIKFFSRIYKPNHINADRKYLSWQYRDIPSNPFYPDYSNLLLLKNGSIVGHLGLIPYKFKIKGREFKVASIISLIVDDNLRGFGGGAFLVREAEKYFDILYDMGFNANAAPLLQLHKWAEEQKLKRWVYLSNTNKEKFSENDGVIEIGGFDETWDKSWEELRKHYPITIDRNSRYLNWRYRDNPYIHYKIFGIKNADKYSGYMVLRKESGDEFTAYRVVDFISGPETAAFLVQKALNLANAQRVDFLDFFSSSSMYEEALKKSGFHLYEPQNNPEPPIFILPVDRSRTTAINFSYKFINPDINNYKPDDWFVVKADSDRDRAW